MSKKKWYTPKKKNKNKDNKYYYFTPVELLIIEKEFNIDESRYPKCDYFGREEFKPCIKKIIDSDLIEKQKNKLYILKKIMLKIELKRKEILEKFPLEILTNSECFEMDRLDFYLRSRWIRAEMLFNNIYNSIS